MNTKNTRWLVAGVVLCCLAQGAGAAVLYDTFGSNDSYLGDTCLVAGDPFAPYGPIVYPAARFDVQPGSYDNIAVTMPLKLWNIPDPANFPFEVKIYADDGTPEPLSHDLHPDEHCPGTPLATLGVLASDVQTGSPTTLNFGALTLAGDATYWLAVETPLAASGAFKWYLNDQNVTRFTAQRCGLFFDFPDEWVLNAPLDATDPAMRVEGTLVPEPASALALLLGVALARRRLGL